MVADCFGRTVLSDLIAFGNTLFICSDRIKHRRIGVTPSYCQGDYGTGTTTKIYYVPVWANLENGSLDRCFLTRGSVTEARITV